jgi:galactokinase
VDPELEALVRAVGFPPGSRVVAAPGRVNLIGDHTDYNQGYCLPMAINRWCLVGVHPISPANTDYNLGFCLPVAIDRACTVEFEPDGTRRLRLTSAQMAGTADIEADGHADPRTVEPPWARFAAGVARVLGAVAPGAPPGGAVAVSSTVPAGSGLSSSSALTVALLLALGEAAGVDLTDRTAVARLALDAEVQATGVPGGLMDQLASLYGVAGHALLLDCRDLSVATLALPSTHAVLVVHSGLPRTLAGSAYAERRAACEGAAARLGLASLRDARPAQVADDPFARHVVSENARVLAFADALRAGDVNALGPLLLASHASLRDDFAVSTPELDLLVELLVEHGAIGARLTGAGFGGCVVALVQRNHADDCAARTTRAYARATDVEPHAFVVRAVDGAGPIDRPG